MLESVSKTLRAWGRGPRRLTGVLETVVAESTPSLEQVELVSILQLGSF